MKKSLTLLTLLALVSCNQATIQTAAQGQIDTNALDMSTDIKDEVILTIAPLDMFNSSECTQLKENIFMYTNAHLDKAAQTLQFETSYFANDQDCINGTNYIGMVLRKYLIRKISQVSTGTVTKYNIDLMVLLTQDMMLQNFTVNGLVYEAPMDELDIHHNNYNKIGVTEYMTFEKGADYISFPFTYVTSGDNHAQRRSYIKEVMVVIPETQPVVFGGGQGNEVLIQVGKEYNDEM